MGPYRWPTLSDARSRHHLPGHDIIVLGASAGGVEALAGVVSTLPADLPAAVFVVLHVPSRGMSFLPSILARAGTLPVEHAVDVNDEVRRRSEELREVNRFLEAILTSLRGAVVVLDRELRVTVWNNQSMEMWGLRPDEALGRPFFSLDIGLPVDELRHPIRLCVSGESPIERFVASATNRRGRPVTCEVTCVPLLGTAPGAADGAEPRGVVLIVE